MTVLQGQIGESLLFQNEPYLGHTFQVPMHPQYDMAHPGYPGGM